MDKLRETIFFQVYETCDADQCFAGGCSRSICKTTSHIMQAVNDHIKQGAEGAARETYPIRMTTYTVEEWTEEILKRMGAKDVS